MSNVVVMVSGEQNTSAEVAEIAKTKGNTFQRFNSIVAALSKTVGIREIKSVEDIRFPITKHSGTRLKLWYG